MHVVAGVNLALHKLHRAKYRHRGVRDSAWFSEWPREWPTVKKPSQSLTPAFRLAISWEGH
jgi:hypothetical protein